MKTNRRYVVSLAFLVTDGDRPKIIDIITSEDCLCLLVDMLRQSQKSDSRWDLAALFREHAICE